MLPPHTPPSGALPFRGGCGGGEGWGGAAPAWPARGGLLRPGGCRPARLSRGGGEGCSGARRGSAAARGFYRAGSERRGYRSRRRPAGGPGTPPPQRPAPRPPAAAGTPRCCPLSFPPSPPRSSIPASLPPSSQPSTPPSHPAVRRSVRPSLRPFHSPLHPPRQPPKLRLTSPRGAVRSEARGALCQCGGSPGHPSSASRRRGNAAQSCLRIWSQLLAEARADPIPPWLTIPRSPRGQQRPTLGADRRLTGSPAAPVSPGPSLPRPPPRASLCPAEAPA